MKFFGWMQDKFNGRKGSNGTINNTNGVPPSYHKKESPREDLSPDWPRKLLTIGTFGNDALTNANNININNTHDHHHHHDAQEDHEPSSSSSSIQEFTVEEVGELQKELTKLLSKKPTDQVLEKELLANLPLDRFLNCPSSLEVDRRISINNALGDHYCSHDHNDEDHIERAISAILGRCKDICSDNNSSKKKGIIGKKSVSFLLRRMFLCGAAASFAPQPSLRDTLQESRIEKLLRTMLHKKIYSQNNNPAASRASSMKRILDDHIKTPRRHQNNNNNNNKSCDHDEDETLIRDRNSSADGHKWVKTDSEYIVLEI